MRVPFTGTRAGTGGDEEPPSLFDFDPQEIITNPSAAEDALHGALTLRALRWLDILERDERDSNGKPVFDLELQVSMFRVISEWLKTSKRTKGGDQDDSIPGIDQMRQIIKEELDAAKPEPTKRPGAHTSPVVDRRYKATKPKSVPQHDDSKLDALIERARRISAEDEDDN